MPRLTDDGYTTTLDLHGLDIDRAIETLKRTLSLAHQRGRASLRVVHGSSSSDPAVRNRTIKHALYDLLESDQLPTVTSSFRLDGATLLSLPVSADRDPQVIRLADVHA